MQVQCAEHLQRHRSAFASLVGKYVRWPRFDPHRAEVRRSLQRKLSLNDCTVGRAERTYLPIAPGL